VTPGPSQPGCACDVGPGSGGGGALALSGLAALVILRRRAKRSRR
jgi:MYXO-CTERM domain-containing protein